MKIVDMKTTWICIPIEKPMLGTTGVHPGRFSRAIVELIADEGIVGLGEVGGGDQRAALERLKPRLIGESPFDLERIRQRTLRQVYYISNSRLYSAIEIACLDIQGKSIGRPVSDLLGGKIRDKVPMCGYLFFRYGNENGGDELTVDTVTAEGERLIDTYGFKSIKLKGGGYIHPQQEADICFNLRKKFGRDLNIRYDPNGSLSLGTGMRLANRFLDCDLEYFEDPVWGIEAMSNLRKSVNMPLATNMCVKSFDDLGPGITRHAIDIVLSDLYYWEGPRGVKRLAAVCEAMGVGLSMHSGTEFGITMAAMLHTAATTPYLSHDIDAHYHHLTDDIIVGGPLPYKDGCMEVPAGPGLGVELDPEKVEKYSRYAEEKGDYYKAFLADDRRPDWFQIVPGW
jgi:glucarate dehydratase